jgi:hypothetical protein
MKSAYYQCKMARAASLGSDSTSVDFDKNGGKTKPVQFNSISSLDCIGDTEVLRTFCGTRMSSNNITVNQNISMSYDPATMKCIVCESGHNILNKGQGDSPPHSYSVTKILFLLSVVSRAVSQSLGLRTVA